MGVAAAGQSPLPYAKAIASWFDDKRGMAPGVAMSGVGLGAALVPQWVQWLVAHADWQYVDLGLTTLVLAVGVPAVALAIREAGPAGAARAAGDTPGLSGVEALKNAAFWKLALAFFAVPLATSGTIAHVVPLLVDPGVAAQIAAGAIAFAGLALTGGRLFAGYLFDRLRAPHVATIFMLPPLAGIAQLLAGVPPQVKPVAIVLIGLGPGARSI